MWTQNNTYFPRETYFYNNVSQKVQENEILIAIKGEKNGKK